MPRYADQDDGVMTCQSDDSDGLLTLWTLRLVSKILECQCFGLCRNFGQETA
jgi:hypothetical protein